jgi:exonuclease III
VRELQELRIESVYHVRHLEKPGTEQIPTFYLQKNLNKPYHIDYLFASDHIHKTLVKFTIEPPANWIGMSDHMPVFCEF